ncbi:MAG TPA: hypothetical protein V6C81_12420 [Planktothrix sp.]|jgi:hypothetical protein
MNEQFRQGDVLLVKVDSLPKGATKEQNDESVVLAYGETTGHAHRLKAETVTMYAWKEDKLIEVTEPTDLTHEEHSPINLTPGIYRVVRQREYTPERIRRVSD